MAIEQPRPVFRSAFAIAVIAAGGWWGLAHADPSPDFAVTPGMPVSMPGTTRVHKTALQEIAMAFPNTAPDALHVSAEDKAQAGGLFVALLGESASAQTLARNGLIDLHNASADADAFEVLLHDDVLYLLGNTPRGMLQAVYEFQEMAREGTPLAADTHRRGTFQISQRVFHQRFDGWPGEPADIRYISHLGASHCLLTHDWSGDLRHLQAYVTSPVFADAINPAEVKKNADALRRMIDTCLDYAIEPALWITELPCQGGPWMPESARQQFLTRFPEEVLSDCGTYQGKVLCFGHPKVQEFYKDLLVRFFGQFPEVSTLYLFGMDSGGEFCDPDRCPRCSGKSKFEQRDRLIRFLVEEGQKARPGLCVLTTGWGWSGDTDQFLARQKELPAASGLYLAAETDGWQAERQRHDLLVQARAVCRERGQTFIGYDDLHWGDDTVHELNDIQDYPMGVGAKIRRWHELEVDGVFDHWGGFNRDISCNSPACRAFFLNPLQDPETVCRDIAVKQFGEAAGLPAFQAWQALERAHAILSNACSWAPTQWPGWYPGRNCAPVPEDFAKSGIHGGEPPRTAGAVIYNPPDLQDRLQRVGDAWRTAFPHYQKAVDCMREAEAKADDSPVFYSFWWSGGGNTPTRREHLRREGIYLESMALVGREIGIHFSLNALFERLQRDPDAYKQQAGDLLHEDMQACSAAADLFERLKAQGDDKQAGRDWAKQYRVKAERIKAYLAGEK